MNLFSYVSLCRNKDRDHILDIIRDKLVLREYEVRDLIETIGKFILHLRVSLILPQIKKDFLKLFFNMKKSLVFYNYN